MSLVTKISARLRKIGKRSDEDRPSQVVPDRPPGGSGNDYRDYQQSLDRNRTSGPLGF